MVKIETWKKTIAIVGIITQAIGYFIGSSLLIAVGLISSIIGIILIFILK